MKHTSNKKGIAIIGMSGRFPGARNLDEFWSNLQNGVESVSFFSDQELEASDIDPAVSQNPNYVKAGAILEDVERFDADFFGFTAREAASLDPQHRLLLECAWESLEHAGYSAVSYNGTIGVYAGSRISEYLICNLPMPDMVGFNVESGSLITNWKKILDNDKDTLATRIAYKLNLKGQAITIQTACSTSLVALHMACQSLVREECDIILAGGVCVRIPQKAGYLYSEGMIFSPDGHTRAFDAKGGGTIFSSGAGMVALKRLDKALADGDCIHAVIRGSAINNDGDAMKAAFTAPSADGQADVIAKALTAARVNPESVTYVETHGTATTHGDLAEISSLIKAFQSVTAKTGFCALGSVKTNIGHPTQAAGIIGLIKTVLMLKNKMLVPHLHFEEPNPQIDFESSPFYVNTALTEWQGGNAPRRAGINSFGVGGTNVHVILEEAVSVEQEVVKMERPTHILCLSAKNTAALEDLLISYENFFSTHPDTPIANICFTANAGRTHFAKRLSVIADSSTAMQEKLSVMSSDGVVEKYSQGHILDSNRVRQAFLFSGQGSQYVDMGRQLFETQPCFRKAMEKCDQLLRPYLEQPLLSVLYPNKGTEVDPQGSGQAEKILSRLDETLYTQTSLFALEYSLYELWKSWGVKPDFVMGHSIGEYVAACVAGVFDLGDALRLVAERGRLMQGLPRNGAMVAVFAGETLVNKFIQCYSDRIAIAAVNGPKNVVISGHQDAVKSLLKDLKQEGIKGQRLTVSHAFHSPLMEPVIDNFERIASKVKYSAPKIKIISNVTGKLVEGLEISCASYWRCHLRKPVMFADSMITLAELGCNTFIEVGPGSTLLGMGRSCVKNGGEWLPSLSKRQKDWSQMLKSLAALYAKGIEVDWSGFDQDYPRQRVVLPTYPFQRKRYWIERKKNKSEEKQRSRFISSSVSYHPLLGKRLPSALREIQFESRLHNGSTTFLQDHHAFGVVILPATAFVEMVMAAASEIFLEKGRFLVEDLVILEALTLPEDLSVIVQLILAPEDADEYSFRIFSVPADKVEGNTRWKCHVTGKIRCGEPAGFSSAKLSLESILERNWREQSVSRFYVKSRERGFVHGPSFQAVKKLWQGDGEALAEIQLPETLLVDSGSYQVHPVLLDACLHIAKVSFPGYDEDAVNKDIYLPIIFEHIHICGQMEGPLWSYTIFRSGDDAKDNIRTIDFFIFNGKGNVVAEILGLHFKRATRQSLLKLSDKFLNDWLYEVRWQTKPLIVSEKARQEQTGKWIIFSNRDDVGSKLIRHLRECGESCITVLPGEFSISINKESCNVNPLLPEDFQKMLAHVRTLPGELRGVVHLWGLERSSAEYASNTSLMDTQALDCASSLHLIQSLAGVEDESPILWIVTRGAQALRPEDSPLAVDHSPLWGLGRVAAREHPKLRCIMVDLDPTSQQGEVSSLFNELLSPDGENQVGFRQQTRHVSRLVRVGINNNNDTRLNVPDFPCFRLETSSSCILNNISFRKLKRCEPGPGEIEIAVRATGLNFRDVLSALGKYPGDPGPLGRECSGIVSAVGDGVKSLSVGDEVLAIAPGSFGNYVITNAYFAVPKPDFLDFEDAASIPITFLTAYYGLFHLSKISAGEKVLIHAASGGVGLAAAQLVEWAGAEIFATASHGKWEFLKSLGVKHIMNSRSLDFVNEVMALTDGQGVDIVLNSLAGDFIPKSFSVLSDKGRFIEIGKSGIWSSEQVNELRPDVSYFPFDLGDVAHQNPLFFQSMFRKLMEGFQKGTLKPLPQKRFSIEDSISAFRYMAQAKHIGKIVVYQKGESDNSKEKSMGVLRSNSTFLITGGLGALGLRIASWMVAQNAQNIVLLGRSAPTNDAREIISKLEEDGAQVHVAQVDISNKEKLSAVLKKIRDDMPPLRGIIHAAGVLDDGVLMQQTWERFVKVMIPKIEGAWNLHALTKNLPLDFFVLFSSVSSFWGTPGQGNYATANAFLDGLAHLRRGEGLPCVSVNWGSWAEVGMAAVLDDNIKERKRTKGLCTIDLKGGLEMLGRMISGDSVQTAVFNMNWTEYMQQFPVGFVPPFFSEMLKEKTHHAEKNVLQHGKQTGLLQQIEKAPASKRKQILSAFVRKQAIKMIGLEPGESLAPQISLFEFGLDSLTAIELRNVFEFSIGCDLPATLLHDHPTLEALCNYLAEKIIPKEVAADTPPELLHNNKESRIDGIRADGVCNGKIALPLKENQTETLPNEEDLSMVPIHTGGSKSPLFLVHGCPLAIHRRLGPEQPLYFFNALWQKGRLYSLICIQDIAAAHIEEIKAVQPEGPYFLGGYSIGGLLAFEVAQQLCRAGDKIAFLFLLEPITPIKFSSKEGAGIVSLRSDKNKRNPLKNMRRKANVAIAKIAFKVYDAVLNSSLPLPSLFRVDYQSVLHRLAQNRRFTRSYGVGTFTYKVAKAVIDSGLPLPTTVRGHYVSRLYEQANNNYISNTYPGPITIYKVKQGSAVDISVWEQLSKIGIEIKEMNLLNHLAPIADENTSEWTRWLEHDLKKNQANWSIREK